MRDLYVYKITEFLQNFTFNFIFIAIISDTKETDTSWCLMPKSENWHNTYKRNPITGLKNVISPVLCIDDAARDLFVQFFVVRFSRTFFSIYRRIHRADLIDHHHHPTIVLNWMQNFCIYWMERQLLASTIEWRCGQTKKCAPDIPMPLMMMGTGSLRLRSNCIVVEVHNRSDCNGSSYKTDHFILYCCAEA